jgi:hypothetical protein
MRRRWLLLVSTLSLIAGCGATLASGSPVVPTGPAVDPTATTGAVSTPSPGATPGPTPTTPALPTRSIRLDGDGPIGMALDDDTAWVIAADGGELLAVDLTGGTAAQSFDVGPWGTHVVVGGPDEVLVARFDTGGVGEPLAIVDPTAPASGAVRYLATGPLAGFDVADDGRLWGFGTLGEIVVVDEARGEVVGRSSIDVNPNEHLDAVAAAGAFWASSDTTAVRRLEGATPAVTATIDTGGGIPLDVDRGLVWGARAVELWAIDPASDTVAQRVPLDNVSEILDLDVADGRAWIAVRKPGRVGAVIGVDIATGAGIGEVPVSLPAAVAIDGDRVWVVNYDGDELIGFDQPPR